MNRIYLIVVLIVAVSALAGCGDQTPNESESANGHEVAELDDLIVPNGLKVMSPEANRMNQELDRSLNRLLDEYDGGNNLSEDEQQAYEEEMEAHEKRVEELEENIMVIYDQEMIDTIFDEIKGSDAVYGEPMDESVIKEGRFYSLEPLYSNRGNDESPNGEPVHLILVFEDNRLYLIIGEEAESLAVIKMEIDYEWIESMLSFH